MSHDDFAVEPIKGLPGILPEGEDILWQGRPNWWALSKDSLNVYWVLGYFIVLAVWRYLSLYQVEGTGYAMAGSLPLMVLGIVACTILVGIAYIQARMTIYTITTKRVVMRIGAALTITFNFPYKKISNANLGLRKDGTGTIALELIGYNKVSYLVLWPHLRPWKMSNPQPAFRCIDNPEEVAKILSKAAETQINSQQITISKLETNNFIAAE
tara:strand:+ start:67 stop:705 length:639 start_codon:yes stop_codon:yes gene_type:complete